MLAARAEAPSSRRYIVLDLLTRASIYLSSVNYRDSSRSVYVLCMLRTHIAKAFVPLLRSVRARVSLNVWDKVFPGLIDRGKILRETIIVGVAESISSETIMKEC